MKRSLPKQKDFFWNAVRRKPRRKLFCRIDVLLEAGNRFVGNIWNGRCYEITIRIKNGGEKIFLSSMPYDKIVDARNMPIG